MGLGLPAARAMRLMTRPSLASRCCCCCWARLATRARPAPRLRPGTWPAAQCGAAAALVACQRRLGASAPGPGAQGSAEPAAARPEDEGAPGGRGQPAARRPPWRKVASWLTPEAQQRGGRVGADDFVESVPPFWRAQLARVRTVEALKLIRQLGGDNVVGWLKHSSAAKLSALMEQLFAWKAELPECIMLVQVGDFFEAWGADAVMLVQWGALNPMARKPRAGFPATAASLQQALDNLTGADLSVAVVVQTGRPGQPNQPREIKQVVTPGAPTYLFGHELKLGCDGAGDLFSEGRPYVALRFRVDGLLYAELSPFRREVRYREHVTPDGVEALLAEHESIASPAILDGHRGAFQTADRWPWFPKDRKWLGLPQDVGDAQFLDECCRTLCRLLHLEEGPPFSQVRLDGSGALQPLSLTTARNLGVVPFRGVPSLVQHMLPDDVPALARRMLQGWLLAPRSGDGVDAMRELLRLLGSSDGLVLPPLQRLPSAGKIVAFVTAKAAPAKLFGDIDRCCKDARAVLRGRQYAALLPPLLRLVALEVGKEEVREEAFAEELDAALALIGSYLPKPGVVQAAD